ncbi:MAG TPA: hypothetical protein VJ989_03480 [Solirubrobacterales bacterium]|nr:hypothetical protein [Solirubrobacterales bacterium]
MCLVAFVAVAALCAPAAAHGPCPDCVMPDKAAPGQKLLILDRAYKAVLNPSRGQLELGARPNCYGCHLDLWKERMPGVAPVVLGEWRPPRQHAEVRVPQVPPGRYLLAVYDGSESGTHYTWDFIRVTDQTTKGAPGIALVGLLAAVALVLAIAAFLLRRRARATV